MAKVLIFPCVHVYEARNSYWPGKILKGISGGASLYQTRHEDRPWGFKIHTNEETEAPHAVEFENGVLWGFCCMSERLRTVEWPRFLADYFERGDRMRCSARVENLFSDSMHLTLVSEPIDREQHWESCGALLPGLLIWHHYRHAPPQ